MYVWLGFFGETEPIGDTCVCIYKHTYKYTHINICILYVCINQYYVHKYISVYVYINKLYMYIWIYFKELAHMIVGTGKPKIYRARQQARNSDKSLYFSLESKSWKLS